ncbi:hypothetical protein JTP77_041160, partial [Streptomyces sp. S9]|nr:hypothetical protein [Streptomyces sp. S9]
RGHDVESGGEDRDVYKDNVGYSVNDASVTLRRKLTALQRITPGSSAVWRSAHTLAVSGRVGAPRRIRRATEKFT